ncbi:hypothetical protein ACVK00_001038 [Burkholderia sp. PvR073]|uniref:hypothetical protein n=1 Tax=Burkholderia TaxID=32008 RepID=UPI001E5181E8|nr:MULTISPECIES: hypothetical protein [unclassified Burkholderia]UEP44335.1 hypothetical protein LMA02_30360 [Burkholderia sp. B21-005]
MSATAKVVEFTSSFNDVVPLQRLSGGHLRGDEEFRPFICDPENSSKCEALQYKAPALGIPVAMRDLIWQDFHQVFRF